jgi:hypothetical protein
MKDEDLRKLFSGAGVTPSENAFGKFMSELITSNAGAELQKSMVAATIELTRYQQSKQALLRLLTLLAVRLSLFASVWVWLFDAEKWPGMVMFAVLSVLLSLPATTASKTNPK